MMKNIQITKLLVMVSIMLLCACKKYGYNVKDGYPDESGNKANGDIINTSLKVDKSMYSQARVFPGLVDEAEPRVQDAKFTLDLDFTDQTANNLRISVAPEPQFSTGYYAAPGELIKLVVPPGIEGLSVQVGGQTDDLSGAATLLRTPVLYMRQQLFSGVNYFRILFGGTIYIRADKAYKAPVEFTISDACVSPDFVLGKSTDAAWVEQVKKSHVPWLELRSKRVIFLIPRDRVMASFTSSEPFTNPNATMTKWNELIKEDYNEWLGLSDNASEVIDKSPQGAWRAVLDIQLTFGAGHSGFPVVFHDDLGWFQSLTSLTNITTGHFTWGPLHEIGHNCQQGQIWSWGSLIETTCNLHSIKFANRIGVPYTVAHSDFTFEIPKALAFANSSGPKDFDGTDPGINNAMYRMVPFIQLFEIYGFDLMTELHKQARRAERLNPNDISKHNFVYEKLSDYLKIDLAPFFSAWGILISDPIIAKVSAKYPQLKKKIWKYNPLTKTGGNEDIVYETSVFSISSKQDGDGDPAFLVDGIISNASFWHSQWSPDPGPDKTFPFTIVLDAGSPAPTPIKGIVFAQRQGNRSYGYVKDVEISVSNDNLNYTRVGALTLPQDDAAFNYNFPNGNISAKYVKVVILNGNDPKFASLSECNLIKP